MKENMKYLTNQYQLRPFTLQRMLDIQQHNIGAVPGGTVFFGDSITELCDLDTYYPEIEVKYNCGISGISASMLLHFIDEGVIKYAPSKVVLMIGTNDLGDTTMTSPRNIALEIKEIVEIIHYNCLNTKLYLVSPLPCVESEHGYKAIKKGIRSNDILKIVFKEMKKVIPYEYVTFINAYPSLCNKKGEAIENYFIDGLHINDAGYVALSECIKKEILK